MNDATWRFHSMALSAVVEELFETVDPSCSTLVIEILDATASVCALAQPSAEEDAEEAPDAELASITRAANSAMGAAIRGLGPQAVLAVLPIKVQVAY